MAEPQRQYVTIGCVNYQSVWGDVDANLEKMKKITAQAAEQGINLLVFPELALSGYECEEEIVSATVNLQALRWWRGRSDWQQARREDVILDEMERLAAGRSQAKKD